MALYTLVMCKSVANELPPIRIVCARAITDEHNHTMCELSCVRGVHGLPINAPCDLRTVTARAERASARVGIQRFVCYGSARVF